jgi:hypothetical protein
VPAVCGGVQLFLSPPAISLGEAQMAMDVAAGMLLAGAWLFGGECRQMASKKRTLGSARRALRDHAARRPEANELFGILQELGKRNATSADGEVAIIGPAYIEYGLEQAITEHFREDLAETDIKRIFRGDHERPGTLSDFAAKIDLAYVLGILTDEAREDLHSIRLIRNSFAHSMFRLSMRDKEVTGLMQRLHLRVRDQSVEPLHFTVGMQRLILSFAIAQYYFRLITYPTMGRVTSTVEPLS